MGPALVYGTVVRYRLRPGHESDLLTLIDELTAALPQGYVAAYTYRLDSGGDDYITAAVWTDRETYARNANHDRQRRWYERVRELLVEEPSWHDGEVIHGVTVRRGVR
jgi:hypothetical protein